MKLPKTDYKVFGIGTNENNQKVSDGGKLIREYVLWTSILNRCSKKCWDRFPTYVGTNISENFKSYEYFYEWCQEQIGFNTKDRNNEYWQLDKDILVKGNKIYSEDTCCFIPQELNTLFVKRVNKRGKHPIGVCLDKRTSNFIAQCNARGRHAFLGRHKTEVEAFYAYKTFKEALIKEVANEYKSQLDTRTYDALMNYAVEITD